MHSKNNHIYAFLILHKQTLKRKINAFSDTKGSPLALECKKKLKK